MLVIKTLIAGSPPTWISVSETLKTFFFNFCFQRNYELVSKFKVGSKSLFELGLSESEFYSELVCKLKTTE